LTTLQPEPNPQEFTFMQQSTAEAHNCKTELIIIFHLINFQLLPATEHFEFKLFEGERRALRV
jgi:hypothetical protein